MKFTNLILAAFLLIATNNASAISITGGIGFTANFGTTWTPTDALLNPIASPLTADGVIFHTGDPGSTADGLVQSTAGTYSVVTLGTSVDFKDFVFDPLVPNTQLWTFDFGGDTYSFSMSNITTISQTANSISLEGDGFAFIDGFDNTDGDFTLTLNNNGSIFNFSSSVAVVPVPAAVWLFGSGLLGLVGIARRKAA